jgi:16S rRNA processing protein RimM
VSARAWDELIAIGVVRKPQGLRGEVAVTPLSDRPERFPELRRAFVPGPGGAAREVTVEDCRPHKGGFVLKLKGVDGIDAAETLRGLELRIGADELDALPEGSYYHHQLVGLRALDARGHELGRVERVWETGAEAPVLVLGGPGGEILVPLAQAFVGAIDLQAGTLRVTLHDEVTVDAAR